MSREILFRGQTRRKGERIINVAGDKCDSNWVYGGIFPQNEDEKGFAIIYQQYPEIEKYPVYADTIGQYTGKTDINGKKIWEGDIVKQFADCDELGNNLYFFYEIKWNKEYCAFEGIEIYSGETFLFPDLENIEVIGNIFDNPEFYNKENS